jgi:peptidoglycan/LPS O-acetylase OafA/YrhL
MLTMRGHGRPVNGARHRQDVPRSLAERFDPRANALDVIRLTLATIVAVAHALEARTHDQPRLGGTLVGDLAVDGFFVISGFLVARSYLRLGSLRRFAWHRFLRIMPAFWVCLALTAFVAAPLGAILVGRSAGSVFTADSESSLDYLGQNATLLIRRFGIAGLPAGTGTPEVWNGSLWTLFYEACCYALLAVLGVCGILGRRRWAILLGIVTVWAVIALRAAGHEVVPQQLLPRFVLLFLLGTAGHIFAARIRLHGGLAGIAAGFVVLSTLIADDYRILGALPFAYLCLWLIVALPSRRPLPWDLSYGVYIYHWPIQQLCLMADATIPPALFVIMALILAGGAAALSWVTTERPALRHKDATWVTRRPASPGLRLEAGAVRG